MSEFGTPSASLAPWTLPAFPPARFPISALFHRFLRFLSLRVFLSEPVVVATFSLRLFIPLFPREMIVRLVAQAIKPNLPGLIGRSLEEDFGAFVSGAPDPYYVAETSAGSEGSLTDTLPPTYHISCVFPCTRQTDPLLHTIASEMSDRSRRS